MARDGEQVALTASAPLALLAYLLAEPAGGRRSFLATLLWPDLSGERGLANLRHALHTLRGWVGAESFHASRSEIRWGEPAIDFDLARLQSGTGDFHRLYRGPFCQGLDLKGCEDFEEWLSLQRQLWDRLFVSRCAAEARALEQAGRREQAREVARAGLQCDPEHEELLAVVQKSALELRPRPVLPATSARLIGRENELQLLRQSFEQRTLTVLWGRGGGGKTCLVAELLQGLPEERPIAYLPCRAGQVLERLLLALLPWLEQPWKGRVLERPDLAEQLTLLAPILTSGPLVLVLDDLEQLQSPDGSLPAELLGLLECALSFQHDSRLILISRLRVALPDHLLGGQAHQVREIELEPGLPLQASTEFLRELGGALRSASQDRLETVAECLGGVPRLLERFAGRLANEPWLSLEGLIEGPAMQDLLENPSRELMQALTPPAREVMEILALVGQPVSLGLLAGVHSALPLAELLRSQALRLEGDQLRLHPLDRDRLRPARPSDTVRQAAARLLEAIGSWPEAFELLEPQPALELLDRQVEPDALSRYEMQTLRARLESWPETPGSLAWRGWLHSRLGDDAEAERLFLKALDSPSPYLPLAALGLCRLRANQGLGETEHYAHLVETAPGLTDRVANQVELERVYPESLQGRFADSEARLARLGRRWDRLTALQRSMLALNWLLLDFLAWQPARFDRHFEEFLPHLDQGLARHLSQAWGVKAYVDAGRGCWDDSQAAITRAVTLAEPLPDPYILRSLQFHCAMLAWREGDRDRARDLLTLCSKHPYPTLQEGARLFLGLLEGARPDPPDPAGSKAFFGPYYRALLWWLNDQRELARQTFEQGVQTAGATRYFLSFRALLENVPELAQIVQSWEETSLPSPPGA